MPNASPQRETQVAYRLSNNFARLLREFSRDFERRIYAELAARGYPDVRVSHHQVFANIGLGAVRVTELAERAQVTQQAMGKMLKELERLGYIVRGIDDSDRRAKQIRLTERGIQLAADCLDVVDGVMVYYRARVGAAELSHLEDRLRDAVGRLGLEYLPESWVQAPAASCTNAPPPA